MRLNSLAVSLTMLLGILAFSQNARAHLNPTLGRWMEEDRIGYASEGFASLDSWDLLMSASTISYYDSRAGSLLANDVDSLKLFKEDTPLDPRSHQPRTSYDQQLVGEWFDLNLYQYSTSKPIALVDPLGLCTCPAVARMPSPPLAIEVANGTTTTTRAWAFCTIPPLCWCDFVCENWADWKAGAWRVGPNRVVWGWRMMAWGTAGCF